MISVAFGGTGASTLSGYVRGNGTGPLTAVAQIPSTDISGLVQARVYGSQIDALDRLAGTGIYAITAYGTSVVRTLTGTTNRLTITNGDGVAANPTFDISAAYVGQSTITTLGTITTGVWNGTIITTVFTQAQVVSLSGVTNRTAITGTANIPIIDISALYAGQSTITTLGTILTGVWNGTIITTAFTQAQVVSLSGVASRTTITGTATVPIIDISSLYAGQSTIVTLGTITTGIWNAGAVTSSGVVTGTQHVSTIATGTAPIVVSSSTVVPILNVSQLLGFTWAVPGAIGATTCNTGAFTTGNFSGFMNSGDATATAGVAILNALFSTSTATGLNLGLRKSNAGANPPGMGFFKSRGTEAIPTIVVTADSISQIVAYAFNGTAYVGVSQIRTEAEGTVSAGIVPARLVFQNANAAGVLTECLRIDSTGLATFAGAVTGAFNGTLGATTPNTAAFTALTVTAVAALSVNLIQTGVGSVAFIDGYSGGAIATNHNLAFRAARGTVATPTASQLDDRLGWFNFRGYGTTGFAASARGALTCYAAENWTDIAQGTYFSILTTTLGTTAIVERMRVDAMGLTSFFGGVAINGNISAASWLTLGVGFQAKGNTYINNSTAASTTVATGHIHTFAAPTLAATNTLVTTTSSATVFIAGAPIAGTNATITQPRALLIGSGVTEIGGALFLASGSLAAPAIAFAADSGFGLYRASAGRINWAANSGTSIFTIGIDLSPTSNICLNFNPNAYFGFSSATDPSTGALDTGFSRGGAGIMEQKNSTNAQAYRLYQTFTDASNYSRLGFNTAAGRLTIAAESAGTGTANVDLEFNALGTGRLRTNSALALINGTNNNVVNNSPLKVDTTGATITELTTDGAAGSAATNRIVVPANTTLSVVVNICAKVSATSSSKQMLRQFLICNSAGVTTIEGAVTTLGTDVTSIALAAATTTITANTTNSCISIQVTGIAATNIRWTAYVVSCNVLYP